MNQQQANLKIQQLFSAHSNGDFQQVLNIALELQKHFPKFILGYKAAGVALVSLNKKSEAIKHLKTAVNLDSNDAEALSNLGQTLIEVFAEKNSKNSNKLEDKKELVEAEKYLKKAVKLTPNSAVVNNNLSNVYFSLQDFDKAEFFASQAIKIDKNYSLAYQNLGLACCEKYAKNNDKSLAEKAKVNLKKALEFKDSSNFNNFNNLNNLINLDKIYLCLGRIAVKENLHLLAEKYFWQVIELKASNVEQNTKNIAISELLFTYYQIGESSKAYELSKKFYTNNDYDKQSNELHIFIDNYCENLTLQQINNTINNYKNYVAKSYQPLFDYKKFYKNTNKEILKNKKVLNIGFVSGDLNFHAVSYFIFGVFNALKNNNAPFNLYTFITQKTKSDTNSQILNSYITKSFNITDLDDKKAAQLIHKQNIDILFDLSNHTKHNRLNMFAHKPAPIQVSWIGLFFSTAIPEMDYFLVDKFCVPNEQKYELQFTEIPYRFNDVWEVYTPTAEVNLYYQQHNYSHKNNADEITLASYNDTTKVTPKTFDLWAKVLQEIPMAKFFWMRFNFDDADFIKRCQNEFVKRGIDKNRVDFLPYISPEDYLKSYSKVDFVLDSFPVSGMTTTAEALCMGVPVLTLLGERMPSRLSGSCLNAVGLHEWICNDEQEFVEKAKYFAAPQQRDYLQNLHKTLRERTMKSPLCDTQKLAENFEKAMWHFWQNFVNQL